MNEKFPIPEEQKSKEVFTDDAAIIGVADQEDSLRAFTVSCGVLTLDNREHKSVGIIHLSEGGSADDVVNYASILARNHDLSLKDFSMRRFKGSETIWADAEKVFSKLDLKLPDWETTIGPGIEIEKDTGEVTFYV